jgi:hypothetical protein
MDWMASFRARGQVAVGRQLLEADLGADLGLVVDLFDLGQLTDDVREAVADLFGFGLARDQRGVVVAGDLELAVLADVRNLQIGIAGLKLDDLVVEYGAVGTTIVDDRRTIGGADHDGRTTALQLRCDSHRREDHGQAPDGDRHQVHSPRVHHPKVHHPTAHHPEVHHPKTHRQAPRQRMHPGASG